MRDAFHAFVSLGSRTALGQGIVLAALPLLSRLYGPDAFGIYGTVLAVTGICIIAGTANLDLAMAESRYRRHRQGILVLACATGLAAATAGAIGAGFYFGALHAVGAMGPLVGAAWVFAITLAGVAYHVGVAGRLVEAGPQAAGRMHIGRGLIMVAIATGGYFALEGAAGLLLAHALGFLLVARPRATVHMLHNMGAGSRRRLARAWREAGGYIRYLTPQAVLNSVSQHGAVLLVAALAGVHWAGIYWLAFRAVGVPNMLLGKSLRQISLRTLSAMTAPFERTRFVLRTTLLLLLAYSPVPVFLYFLGGPAFAFVFGEEWRAAAPIGFWLSCWLGFGISNAAAQMMLVHADCKKHLLVFECIATTLRLGALALGLVLAGVVEASAAYAVVGMVTNVILVLWGVRVSRLPLAGRVPA